MTRRTLFLMLLAVSPCLGFFLPGCSHSQPVWPDKPAGKRVLATFTPLYCFAQTIAGDDANVMCLLTSSDPHDAEPTERDVLKVRGADLVLANGLGLEKQYLDKLIGSASKKIVPFELGEVIEQKHHDILLDTDEQGHHHAKGDDHHDDHDPHIWLGPDRAKVMVEIIFEKLSALAPAKKDNFRKRADGLKAELDKLKKYGLEQFKGKKNLNIVTQHDSLAYFADEFGLKIVGYIRDREGHDQGSKEKFILKWKEKDKRPNVLTVEPGKDPKEVETMRSILKREGIDTVVVSVDTIETAVGDPNPDPGYYLKKMYENIDNLAKALK